MWLTGENFATARLKLHVNSLLMAFASSTESFGVFCGWRRTFERELMDFCESSVKLKDIFVLWGLFFKFYENYLNEYFYDIEKYIWILNQSNYFNLFLYRNHNTIKILTTIQKIAPKQNRIHNSPISYKK